MKIVLLFERHPYKLLLSFLGEKWAANVPHSLKGNSSLAFLTAALLKKSGCKTQGFSFSFSLLALAPFVILIGQYQEIQEGIFSLRE